MEPYMGKIYGPVLLNNMIVFLKLHYIVQSVEDLSLQKIIEF